jgi:DNA primase
MSMGDEQRYMFRKAAEAVKQTVPIELYAGELTDLRRVGNSLRGRCPVHGGDSKGAFAVYPDRGRWCCYRCADGGDVIDLCQAVEGGEPWEAMMSLSIRYNVELPQRPPSWFERQDEKGRTREAAKRYVAGVYQRRLTRVYAPLVLVGEETLEEELERLEGLADALWPISLSIAGRRVAGEEE